MADFQVAHLNIEGVNVIITFLGSEFDQKSEGEQNEVQKALEVCARQAGLAGNVVVVWLDSFGGVKFLAPPQQQLFFQTVDFVDLYRQVNKTLTCG